MEPRRIQNVTVVGAGLMGRQIAALLAGQGFLVTLADLVVDPDDHYKLVKAAFDALAKSRPPALASPHDLGRIQQALFTCRDDVCAPANNGMAEALARADLVIEAVKEDLAIKQRVFTMIGSEVREGTVLATNSSGLNLDAIAGALPEALRLGFLGMHFFNPVLYMRLLELIPAAATDSELFSAMCRFGEDRLGKGVVVARNRPNYAANVQGVRLMQWVLHNFQRFDLTVNQADDVCAAIGWGKPFDVLDIVGIALEEDVARTTYDGYPDAPDRDIHLLPDFMRRMIRAGMLGRATKDKGGFYRMGPDKRLLAINVDTLEHGPQDPGDFPSLAAASAAAKQGGHLAGVKALLANNDPAAQFAKALVAGQFAYAVWMLGKACDTTYGLDRAVELGFNHKMGPFALIDALGLHSTVELADTLGIALPGWCRDMMGQCHVFYAKDAARRRTYFTPLAETPSYAVVPSRQNVLNFPKPAAGEANLVVSNDAVTATVMDGVVVVNMHNGRMNTVDGRIIDALLTTVDYAEARELPIVMSTMGDNFSAGADLKLLLAQSKAGDESGARQMSARFQEATWRLRHSSVPVVAATWGFALGGGCEIALAADRIVAATHLRIGLVEAGVGIIPGAGGTWMFLDRCFQGWPDSPARGAEPSYQGALDRVKHAFWTLGTATMCPTAQAARDTGFLRSSDIILPDLDPERVRWIAMQTAKAMALGYVPPRERSYPLPGPDGAAFLRTAVASLVAGGFAHPYSLPIGEHLAAVLTGGGCNKLEMVSALRLRRLEQDHFVDLAMMPHAQKCMEHMLATGKSLLAGK